MTYRTINSLLLLLVFTGRARTCKVDRASIRIRHEILTSDLPLPTSDLE